MTKICQSRVISFPIVGQEGDKSTMAVHRRAHRALQEYGAHACGPPWWTCLPPGPSPTIGKEITRL
eukprot:8654155-Pyramimonas_sp.AAC.1